MGIKQISVFVENKIGNIAEAVEVLSEAGISLRAVSLADTKDFGVLRLLADDTYNAVNALKNKGYIVSVTPVMAVEAEDAPGSLYKLLKIFEQNNINLEYLYNVDAEKTGRVMLIFKVSELQRAEGLVREAGFVPIS